MFVEKVFTIKQTTRCLLTASRNIGDPVPSVSTADNIAVRVGDILQLARLVVSIDDNALTDGIFVTLYGTVGEAARLGVDGLVVTNARAVDLSPVKAVGTSWEEKQILDFFSFYLRRCDERSKSH